MKSSAGLAMKSSVMKRSVVINGHKTSISVEDIFWFALKKIAADGRVNVSELIANIDRTRRAGNLSSVLRSFVLSHYVRRCGDYFDVFPLIDNSQSASDDAAVSNGLRDDRGADVDEKSSKAGTATGLGAATAR